MDKIRFGITGDAIVAFGGDKVLIEDGMTQNHNAGLIFLSELKEKGNTKEHYAPQVQMVFPTLESVCVFRNALNDLEDMFKSGEIKEHDENEKD